VKACSVFLYLEKLGEQQQAGAAATTTRARATQQQRDNATLVRTLRHAIDAAQRDDGWSHLGAAGSHISNQGSFGSRNYGCRKISVLIEATGLFEVRKNGQLLSVRAKKAAAPRKRARKKAAG